MRYFAGLVGLGLALVTVAAPVAAQTATDTDAALKWVTTQQQADGSFAGFGPGDTADALFAFVAAGEELGALEKAGKTPISFLQDQAASYAATSVGAAAKLTMAAVAADADPANFGGTNLLEVIGKSYDPATGQYGADVYSHALALLAIRSVGATPPAAAIQRTLDLQLPDGGWSFDGSAATGSDTNTTSLVVQALAGESSAQAAITKAVAYYKSQQNEDGGFPYSQASSFGNASDANSTAASMQALLAAGEDLSKWAAAKGSPESVLAALQNPSGALRYQDAVPDDNGLATYQAIPAALGKTLPVAVKSIAGAQALVAPVAAPAAAPTSMPSTGGADLPLGWLAIAGGGLLVAGAALRRTRRAA